MKKPILITIFCLSILAIISFVTSLIIEANEKAEFPSGGLYFSQSDSYYLYAGISSNPVITFDCFDVKKGGARFIDYEKFELVDSSLKTYSILDASISVIFSDYYFSRYRITVVLSLNDLTEQSVTRFTKIKLSNNKLSSIHSIGNISVERVNSTGSELSVSGYTQGANDLFSMQIQISNNSSSDVTIKKLLLDLKDVSYNYNYLDEKGNIVAESGDYKLVAGKNIFISITFNNINNNFVYTFIKSGIKYEIDNKIYHTQMSGYSDFINKLDRDGIKKYLNGCNQ